MASDPMSSFGYGVTPKYRDRSVPSTPLGYPLVGVKSDDVLLDKTSMSKAALQFQFFAKIFDLSNPEDMKEYCEIRDKVINKKFKQGKCTDLIQPDGTLKVRLEWCDVSAVLPEGSIAPRPNKDKPAVGIEV